MSSSVFLVPREKMKVRKISGTMSTSGRMSQKNLKPMRRNREREGMESVWYFNTYMYRKTKSGLQLKFDLFDNVEQRIQEEAIRQKR